MTEWNPFRLFESLNDVSFNEGFTKHMVDGRNKVQAFKDAFASATGSLDTLKTEFETATATLESHGTLKDNAYTMKDGGDKATFDAAKQNYGKAEEKIKSFLNGDKVEGITDTVSDDLKKAYKEAVDATKRVTGPANGLFGIARTQEKGFTAALKKNGEKMSFWREGLKSTERGIAIAHGSAVVGSVVGIGDALFRSKDGEGEDRSALMRLGEFVAAGAVGSLALLGGKVAVAR